MCRINRRGATDLTEVGFNLEVVYLRAEQPSLEHIRTFSLPRYKSGVYFCPLSIGVCIKEPRISHVVSP